jgi:hypothetical protein
MREWLFGLAPAAITIYFVLNPAHLDALLWYARQLLH